MTDLEGRKKAFEQKFAHDEEIKFKAAAKRNKMLGEWVAELLNMSAEEASAYKQALVKLDLEKNGDQEVFDRVRADIDSAHVELSDHRLRRTMDELMVKAQDEILKDS